MSKDITTAPAPAPAPTPTLRGSVEDLHAAGAGGKTDGAGVQHYEDGPDDDGPRKIEPSGELVITHDMTPEEKATILRLANEQDPGPKILSGRYVLFVLTALVVILNSGDNGFDGTVMGAVNSMEQFHDYFGFESGATAGTGVVFGMYTVGQVCAFFPNIYLPDKVGRRWAMFLANILQCTGAIITANASGLSMFLFGRWLTGFGCTAANTAAKSYIAEITAPRSRGRWMGVLNAFFYVGQILASGIAIPFGRIQSDMAWRGPMYLQCGPAGINLIFVLFIAESPRWLYARGKKEQAAKILARFHSSTNDPNSPLIRLEMQEFEEGISESGADRQFWNFWALFNTFGNRYRFALCVIVSVWGQLSGNGLITYFLPVLLQQAGIEDSNRQRELNLVNSGTSFVGALLGASVVDHLGRRKLMLFAASACVIGMLIAGGVLSPAGTYDQMRADVGITFIFLFMVFYSIGWTPLQALYPAEVLSYENRAKGLALQGITTNCVSLITTFGMPPALGAVGFVMYFVYAGWNIIGVVVIYWLVVETKQLTLEEMDQVFDSPKPKQRSFELAAEARERAKFAKAQQAQRQGV